MKAAACAVALCLTASPALANFPKWCVEAYEAGDIPTAERMAKSIIGSGRGYDRETVLMGIDCIRRYTGETYSYDPDLREFLSPAEQQERANDKRLETDQRQAKEQVKVERDRQISAMIQRAEEAKAAREQAVAARLSAACNRLYSRDPDGTMTNRVCLDVFWQNGLPQQ